MQPGPIGAGRPGRPRGRAVRRLDGAEAGRPHRLDGGGGGTAHRLAGGPGRTTRTLDSPQTRRRPRPDNPNAGQPTDPPGAQAGQPERGRWRRPGDPEAGRRGGCTGPSRAWWARWAVSLLSGVVEVRCRARVSGDGRRGRSPARACWPCPTGVRAGHHRGSSEARGDTQWSRPVSWSRGRCATDEGASSGLSTARHQGAATRRDEGAAKQAQRGRSTAQKQHS